MFKFICLDIRIVYFFSMFYQHNIGHRKDLEQVTKARKLGSFRKLILFQELKPKHYSQIWSNI